MASIDLNIIQRGAASDFNWTAGPGRITAADLGSIGEQRTDNGGALNAVPTPFARFYVFKEAFRRVLEEKNDKTKAAGRAYEHLVSNCLDVFELLYNKKYHENLWKNNGRKIIIKEWNYEDDLKTLKQQVPILGKAIESYFSDDLGEKKLFFIILVEKGKEYLLATSSPMTGFITPPDLDLKREKDTECVGENYRGIEDVTLKRKAKGSYFKDILLFDKRSADFKNYMYTVLFGDGGTVDNKYRELRDYIQSFKSDPDIKNNWRAGQLSSIFSDENNELVVNGVALKASEDLDTVNYFADAILKVPYKLSSGNFRTLVYVNENKGRSYDYLIPLSAQALDVIGTGDFIAKCKEGTDSVEITINHNGKEFRKTFRIDESGPRSGEGRIFQLDKTSRINLDMAIFPNVLSENEDENNYFKVLVSAFDDNDRKTFSVDNINLDFYKEANGQYRKIPEATDGSFERGVRPAVVRSRQGNEIKCGTKYYEIFNTSFDAILATVTIDANDYTFAVFPKWNRAVSSNKTFDYAIDLGTSNTYISRREKGTANDPQQLTMNNPIVSYLHEKENSSGKNQVICWEDNTPEAFKTAYKTEFIPPYIDGNAYKFPIRTALCFSGLDSSRMSLFDNSDIAFFYEKSMPESNQKIITDIKWASDENSLRIFIRELLLIIKADMLQEDAALSKTGLIWFRPLSLKESDRKSFEKVWEEEAKFILNVAENQIKCYTESEAPYYYFNFRDMYKSVESVAVIDIGGGSTDYVFFEKGDPKIANSVHFGCDALWGNAFDGSENSKKNGIFKKYKDEIVPVSDTLKELNQQMVKNHESTTREIINFWIANDSETKIADKMRKDFPYVFAYHYTAIIYYLASMLKAYGFKHPRTITFSGNGSRYIDQCLTSNVEILTEVTHLIMSDVFGEEVSDIQLVLPDIRKESTCYGGLYYKEGTAHPKTIVYYGDGKCETCKDVEELTAAYNNTIKPAVLDEVRKMNEIYAEVLKFLIRENAVDNVDADSVLKLVNDGVKDTLESKFQKQVVDVYSKHQRFNDALFFIPVKSALFELTNI